jgi:rhodanese-related sulfurtransferase
MLAIKEINAQELHDWLMAKNVLLIDVREAWEYRAGYIPGAINIPLNDIDQVLPIIEEEKPNHIVFQCKSGQRSFVACNIILRNDLKKQVFNLQNGILGWENCGFSILQKN